jgi:hypothetical protein
VHTSNYTNGIDAFECALDVASKEPIQCRIEGCDALCLMAWLGLRMNNEGVEFEGDRTTVKIVQFCLRNIFSEVLENTNVISESSIVEMGAGRIPSRKVPVLLLSVKNAEVSKYFFYDEIEKVVHECVDASKMVDDTNLKDGDGDALPPTS